MSPRMFWCFVLSLSVSFCLLESPSVSPWSGLGPGGLLRCCSRCPVDGWRHGIDCLRLFLQKTNISLRLPLACTYGLHAAPTIVSPSATSSSSAGAADDDDVADGGCAVDDLLGLILSTAHQGVVLLFADLLSRVPSSWSPRLSHGRRLFLLQQQIPWLLQYQAAAATAAAVQQQHHDGGLSGRPLLAASTQQGNAIICCVGCCCCCSTCFCSSSSSNSNRRSTSVADEVYVQITCVVAAK